MRLPSGAHLYWVTASLESVSLRASPPSVRISQTWALGPSPPAGAAAPRALRKLIVLPSGDHSGWDSPRSEEVSWRGAEEASEGTSHTCERCSGGFSPLSASALPLGHSQSETV